MVGVIDGFRWCLLGGESTLHLPGFLLSLCVNHRHAPARRSAISGGPRRPLRI
jgi:hypothetical protein